MESSVDSFSVDHTSQELGAMSSLSHFAAPRLDPAEVELGISTYLSARHAGFGAVSKARYSDFVVHESTL